MQKQTRELRELWAKSAKQSDASRMAGEYTPCCLSEAKTRCSHERDLHFERQRKRCGEGATNGLCRKGGQSKRRLASQCQSKRGPGGKVCKAKRCARKLRRRTAICRKTSPTKAKAMQSTCQWALPSKAKPKKGERGRDSRKQKAKYG